MPLVSLPNGTQLSFPDGMSQDDMRSAIQKNFPEYAPKPSLLSHAADAIGDAWDSFDGSKAVSDTVDSMRAAVGLDVAKPSTPDILPSDKDLDANARPHQVSSIPEADIAAQVRSDMQLPADQQIANVKADATKAIPNVPAYVDQQRAQREAQLQDTLARPEADVGSVAKGIGVSFSMSEARAGLGMVMAYADQTGNTDLLNRAAEKYKLANSVENEYQPKFDSDAGRMAYTGASGLADAAPGLLLTAADPLAGVAAFTGQSLGESYGKYRAAGKSVDDAMTGALGQGSVMAATSFIPLGFVAKNIAKMGVGEFTAKLVAMDIPTFEAQSIASSAIDKSIQDPNKPWGEWLQSDVPDVAKQAVASAIIFSAAGAGAHAIAKHFGGADQSSFNAGTPPVDVAPVSAADITEHAGRVLDSMNAKINGTPDQAVTGQDGAPTNVNYASSTVVPEFVAHRDFIAANMDNPGALASHFGFKLADDPKATAHDVLAHPTVDGAIAAAQKVVYSANPIDAQTHISGMEADRSNLVDNILNDRVQKSQEFAQREQPIQSDQSLLNQEDHVNNVIQSDHASAFEDRQQADFDAINTQRVAEGKQPFGTIDEANDELANTGSQALGVREEPTRVVLREAPLVHDNGDPEDVRNAVSAIASAFGKKVRFVEASDGRDLPAHSWYDPKDPNTIWMAGSGNYKATKLVSHEILHALRTQAPDLYKSLSDNLLPLIDADSRDAHLHKLGYNESADKMEEEGIAEVFGDVIGDKKSMLDLAKRMSEPQAASMFRTAREYVNKAITKLVGKKDLVSKRYVKDLVAARGHIINAAAEYANRIHADEQAVIDSADDGRNVKLTPDHSEKDVSDETMSFKEEKEAGKFKDADELGTQVSKAASGTAHSQHESALTESENSITSPESSTEDEITKAKQALDAAGITGKDRTDTIAQVRQGHLTADEVAESYGINENVSAGTPHAEESESGIALHRRGEDSEEDFNEGEKIDRIVSDFKSNIEKFDGLHPIKVSDNTPASLQVFGWKDHPIYVQPSVVNKILDYHLSKDDLSKIPYLLKRPAMIFADSRNGSLTFLGDALSKGKPTLVALKPDRVANRAVSNLMVTGYIPELGWDEAIKRVMRGELVYRDTSAGYPKSVADAMSSAQKKFAQQPRSLPRELLQGKGAYVGERNYSLLGQSDLVKWEKDNWGDKPLFRRTEKEEENIPYVGPGAKLIESTKNTIRSLLDDALLKIAPMSVSTASDAARNIAKNYANADRLARWQWALIDEKLKRDFTPEERIQMWNAADEQNELMALGKPTDGKGIDRLDDKQRAMMDQLHEYGEGLLQRARDVGMFKGEGVPYWTPRMAVMLSPEGEYSRPEVKDAAESAGPSGVVTSASSLKQRNYLTSAETEAAMKAKLGNEAMLVRDIRTMPMAMARLERAIAGRDLINQIKDLGKKVGTETVSTSEGPKFFTIDSPAFKTFRPRFVEEDGKMVPALDQNGEMIFDRTPIYVSKEFEGPLKAVMSQTQGKVYGALMQLKAKSMGLIMYSPLIHNAVEWGRALPMMPGKVLTFQVYLDGNRIKNDPMQMRQAIKDGMVPIGHRGGMQDITGIMEEPNLKPGRSLTAKMLGGAVGLAHEGAGDAVKRGVDAAGDFWHNTLLWDRVGDLQAGIYGNMKQYLINQGLNEGDAGKLAAHWANRFAGALPNEAMSATARKVANLMLFSRSFTLGNLGVMKDMFTGMPKDIQAQIKMNSGELALSAAKSAGQRKAIGAFVLDIGLMYTMNSMLQDWIDHEKRGKSLRAIEQGYVDRFKKSMTKLADDPFSRSPFSVLGDIMSNSQNEPGKENRIHWGTDANGTEQYIRLPTGKIGEEFAGWMTSPLDTFKKKLSQFARPIEQTFNNDKGFGQRVYNPDAQGISGLEQTVGRVVSNIMKAQIPFDQAQSAVDWYNGVAQDADKAKILAPLAGITFSQGAQGGPALAELYSEERKHQSDVIDTMPDVKRAVKQGDMDTAHKLMDDAHMTPREQSKAILHIENPQSKLTHQELRKFNQHATDDDKERMNQLQDDEEPVHESENE